MSGIGYEGRIVFSENTRDTAQWMMDGLGFRKSTGAEDDTTGSDDVSLRVPVRDGAGTVEFYLHPTDSDPGNQKLGTFHADDVDQQMERMLRFGCKVQQSHTDGPYNTPWGTRVVHMVSPETIEFSLSCDLSELRDQSGDHSPNEA